MTIPANARIAGVTYLVYIVAGMSDMLSGQPQVTALMSVFMSFSALLLGVTLWAITREQDPDLAMIALACRVLEAAPGPGEIYFAVGSTIFCWLLLRGRMIPAGLAWLGVAASAGLVALLLAQRAGFFGGRTDWSSPFTWAVWLPLLVFELTFAAWVLTKGIATHPARHRAPGTSSGTVDASLSSGGVT